MRSEIWTEPMLHEIPAYEVTVRVTHCENRFEIVAKPGAEIDSWWAQAVLAKWIQSRIDAQKTDGHNRQNSLL